MMNNKDIERISKALGDPHRLKILQSVRRQDWMQCADICTMIDLTQSAVSHHIKQLVDSGLLIQEKEGRNMKYTLDKKVMTEYMNFLKGMTG